MSIGLPAARVFAEGMVYGNTWVIATVEAPRQRTLLNGAAGLVRVRFPWVVFITRYVFRDGDVDLPVTGDDFFALDYFDLSVFATQEEPTIDTPLRFLNLPHSIGDVCLGTAEDEVYAGLAPEDAFWNSDFVEGLVHPGNILGTDAGVTVAMYLHRDRRGL